REIRLKKDETIKNIAVIKNELERDRERQTLENRIEAAYRTYKNLMGIARIEEHTKNEVLRGLEALAVEARRRGQAEPLVAAAAYYETSAGFNIQRSRELQQLKDERFMQSILSVAKSHVPFSDEPGIYFPPLKAWQAISSLRK